MKCDMIMQSSNLRKAKKDHISAMISQNISDDPQTYMGDLMDFEYVSTKEATLKLNLTEHWIQQLCKDGR